MFLWYHINILCGLGHESALAAALRAACLPAFPAGKLVRQRGLYVGEVMVSQFQTDSHMKPLKFKAPGLPRARSNTYIDWVLSAAARRGQRLPSHMACLELMGLSRGWGSHWRQKPFSLIYLNGDHWGFIYHLFVSYLLIFIIYFIYKYQFCLLLYLQLATTVGHTGKEEAPALPHAWGRTDLRFAAPGASPPHPAVSGGSAPSAGHRPPDR